ncbi:MAG: tRNA (adenosine(37)-N6)-threonylcarbamoyltransferase complex dimerization subunit type 1 TsaB [Tissierellia bacterium]|nr:tRNA (adenosine(37)-N6)-threonylcarbamoyltransferase complex dimerization subunit type 1 TsaB [Tissierellia bacterium]
MKVLGIDTSTMTASCAVLDGDTLLGEYSINQELTHSESLVPMISEMLDNLKLHISDIDIYGVATGPGSFTGLRIGVATMKAFAHIFDKPIVGVSTLEGLALNLTHSGIIVPMIDARRDRVYTGIYRWKQSRLENILEPCIMNIERLSEILDKNDDDIMINGNGVRQYGDRLLEVLKSRVKIAPAGLRECRAASIAELSLLNRDVYNRDDYYNLIPTYLKESQAQVEFNRKESGS